MDILIVVQLTDYTNKNKRLTAFAHRFVFSSESVSIHLKFYITTTGRYSQNKKKFQGQVTVTIGLGSEALRINSIFI